MKNKDQWFIGEKEIWLCRDGKGIVSDHIPLSDHAYHRVSGRELRYVIEKYNGRDYLPHLNYESPISEFLSQAACVITKTRKYKRELDRTYFKYYDDAEEVMRNIIKFCTWLQKPPRMNKRAYKMLQEMCHHLIKDVPDFLEDQKIRQSMHGSKVRMRSQLETSQRIIQDELDLVGP